MLKLKMPGNPGIFNLGNSIYFRNVITELTHKSAVSKANRLSLKFKTLSGITNSAQHINL